MSRSKYWPRMGKWEERVRFYAFCIKDRHLYGKYSRQIGFHIPIEKRFGRGLKITPGAPYVPKGDFKYKRHYSFAERLGIGDVGD